MLVPCDSHLFYFFSIKLYAYSIGYVIAYAEQKCTLIYITAKLNNVYIYIGKEQHTKLLQLYSVKGKRNYVNTPTDVLKEFRDGAITTKVPLDLEDSSRYGQSLVQRSVGTM